MAYTVEDYQRERAICDKAQAYAERIMRGGAKPRNYLTAEEAAAPEYAACDNAMRGRVEQFEILRDMPDKFGAYLSDGATQSEPVGARLAVTVWTGDRLGTATVHTVGKRRGYSGERQLYGRATINGREYAWQGKGAGMFASFRAVKA